jgi:hypothetical protein
MSKPTAARETASPEVRHRQLRHALGGLGLVIAVAVLAVFVLRKKAPEPVAAGSAAQDERLQAAVAAVDRLDPRWRFAELEEDRAKVPPDENAAPLVMACHTLIPKELNGLDTLRLRDDLRKGAPADDRIAALESAKALFFKARELANFSRGRHAVPWNLKDPLLTPLPHVQATHDMVDLLTLGAEVRAHKGDVDGALVLVHAALVATHAIGDEPMLLSQVRRVAGDEWRLGWSDFCVLALEESLGRGQATEKNLRDLQTALEAEAEEPVMRTAARAERAGLHALLTAVERGELTQPEPALLGVRAEGVSLLLTASHVATVEAVHAWVLDYTTKFVEIAGLPSQEQAPRLKELAATLPKAPREAIPLLAGLPVVDLGETCHKARALLRCAAAGMALERYRLANGHWPDALGELAPKYLAAVPADSFDGKPLRYARHNDGVIVHSVGPGGKESGPPDDPKRFEKKDGADVSFRLWNVAARNKAAK